MQIRPGHRSIWFGVAAAACLAASQAGAAPQRTQPSPAALVATASASATVSLVIPARLVARRAPALGRDGATGFCVGGHVVARGYAARVVSSAGERPLAAAEDAAACPPGAASLAVARAGAAPGETVTLILAPE
jgi:dienelactone hydrolase